MQTKFCTAEVTRLVQILSKYKRKIVKLWLWNQMDQ